MAGIHRGPTLEVFLGVGAKQSRSQSFESNKPPWRICFLNIYIYIFSTVGILSFFLFFVGGGNGGHTGASSSFFFFFRGICFPSTARESSRKVDSEPSAVMKALMAKELRQETGGSGFESNPTRGLGGVPSQGKHQKLGLVLGFNPISGFGVNVDPVLVSY